MPIILENSHSHSFTFTDENGVRKDVHVTRGQDIEQLGIPLKQLTKILAEYVVTFDGSSERPRYKHVDEMPEETGTYSSGPVTQALVTRAAQKADPNAPVVSPEERLAAQRKAEAEMAAEAQAQFDEAAMLQQAENERVAREAAEAQERADAAEAKMAEMTAKLEAAEKAAAEKAAAKEEPKAEAKAEAKATKTTPGKNK